MADMKHASFTKYQLKRKEEFYSCHFYRGAAHIHGVLWLNFANLEKLSRHDGKLMKVKNPIPDDCPLKGLSNVFSKMKNDQKLEADEINVLTEFIDEFTTVSTHEGTVGEMIVSQVQEVNIHHHTKTCYKKGSFCRFGFPRPPSPYTIISRPVGEMEAEDRKKLFKKQNDVISKVMMVLDTDEDLKKIMEKFDKKSEITVSDHAKGKELRIREACKMAKVDFEDYVQALSLNRVGYKIVMSRDVDELNVNNYNVEWMRNWNANLDIQIAIDFFAIITYITNYISKPDTTTVEIVKNAMKETPATDYKERMRIAANVFLKNRQIGESEAVYRLIPSLTLSMSNVSCQFVSTGVKDERSVRWIKATEEQLQSGVKAVQLDNQEGYFFQQQTMWDKYLRRPDSLEDICFAQFAKCYQSLPMGQTKKLDDADDDLCEPCSDEEDNVNVEEGSKFDFIMRYDKRKGRKMPDTIVLNDPQPGEASMMKKRRKPCALRFHKVQESTDPLRYMLSELMLYKPLRDEVPHDDILALFEETFDDASKIENVKSQVMEFLESVSEARFYAEEAKKELELEQVAENMDAQGQQENDDCQEEGFQDHPEYLSCNPGKFLIQFEISNLSLNYLEISSWRKFLYLSFLMIFLYLFSWRIFLYLSSWRIFLYLSSKRIFLYLSSWRIFLYLSSWRIFF